jgi:hypothetical protein
MKPNEHAKPIGRAAALPLLELGEQGFDALSGVDIDPVVRVGGALESCNHVGAESTWRASCDRCGLFYNPDCFRCVARRLARRHGAGLDGSQREHGSGRPGLSPTRRAPGAGAQLDAPARRTEALKGPGQFAAVRGAT